MDTNESIRTNAPEEIIVLGVASVETKGPGVGMELAGPGQQITGGIALE